MMRVASSQNVQCGPAISTRPITVVATLSARNGRHPALRDVPSERIGSCDAVS
jgi:hypothetical protein